MERIEIDPEVMQGKPVVRGTRVPVELLLRKLAEGASIEDLLDAYPRLTVDDIRSCLTYAADTIASRICARARRPLISSNALSRG